MMGLVERVVARATQDEARDQRLERQANEADASRTEQPEDTPR